ncbi:MAG: Gfo/Idh/MocA family oxidoreductase [Planctomycetes bacterium]|nr:Gfo/Idh/MocA family oxidoreductase [Planctomycetota bacterium]
MEYQVGVIGCGEWGPNHIRNFNSIPGCRVRTCVDLREERRQAVSRLFRGLKTSGDVRAVLDDPKIHGVVVATPTATHFDIVRDALLAGKDVLCEKPLAPTADECAVLVDLAEERSRILMVGHVFLYNPGIRRLRESLLHDDCGRIYYVHAERTNLGPFRRDVSAVFDLASHDVSILLFLLAAMPTEVSARGECYLQPNVQDVAFLSIAFPNAVLANVHVSWLDPKKVRRLTVVGDRKMIAWDDLDATGPIRIYDKGVVRSSSYRDYGEFQLLAREGDVTIPRVAGAEPLKLQSEQFLRCVRERVLPESDGRFALNVVRVLEAAQRSIAQGGAPSAVAARPRATPRSSPPKPISVAERTER